MYNLVNRWIKKMSRKWEEDSRNLFLDAWFKIHPSRNASWLAHSTIESSTFLPLTDSRIKKRHDMEKNCRKIFSNSK